MSLFHLLVPLVPIFADESHDPIEGLDEGPDDAPDLELEVESVDSDSERRVASWKEEAPVSVNLREIVMIEPIADDATVCAVMVKGYRSPLFIRGTVLETTHRLNTAYLRRTPE